MPASRKQHTYKWIYLFCHQQGSLSGSTSVPQTPFSIQFLEKSPNPISPPSVLRLVVSEVDLVPEAAKVVQQDAKSVVLSLSRTTGLSRG